jgi:hypothetical protein
MTEAQQDKRPWYEWIAFQLKSAFQWLWDDDDGDGLPNILEAAMTIVSTISLFNSREPSDLEKSVAARNVLTFMKFVPRSDLERLVELKQTGALDRMKSAQMDQALGIMTAAHVEDKKGTVLFYPDPDGGVEGSGLEDY